MTDLAPESSEFEDLDAPEEDTDVPDIAVPTTSPSRWKKVIQDGLVIPFRTVHEEPKGFKVGQRNCFIPGKPVEAKIVEVERTVSTHFLNANLYVIELQHGGYKWTIKRRYKHFQHLHQQLMLYRVTLSVPFPSRSHQERRSTFRNLDKNESGKSPGLPRFPKRPEALVASDHLEERKEALEEYLNNLLKIRSYRNHHETLEFLEVSNLSFVHDLGIKGKESLILKRTGATPHRCGCGWCSCFGLQKLCGVWCGQWQRRWLLIKDTFVAYIRPKDGRIHCVMLFDNEFDVSSAMYDVEHGIVLANLSRRLVVKCWTKRKAKEWLDQLRKVMGTEVARGFIGENRFLSFAPIRRGIDATWYADGSSYMDAVSNALESAQEEIFIADWWLSPEIYMKRPIFEGEKWRLDKIIERKATKDGVKVFILLYKEVSMALGINSYYSKQKLVEKCPENIKVLRHPDHAKAGVLLWAHHEKLVIVDQTIAFVGGIDLCYGRWDDHKHRLTDLGSVSAHQKLAGIMHSKITSSKPAGSGAASSLLQLAKATNIVSIGPLVDHNQLSRAAPEDVVTQSEIAAVHATPANDKKKAASTEVEVNGVEITVPDVVINGEINESASVESISKIAGEEGAIPLKGETPPTGRRARLIRRMTAASNKVRSRIKRRSSESSSTSSDSEAEKDENKRTFRLTRKKKSQKEEELSETVTPSKQPEVATQNDLGLQGSSKLWIGKDYTNFIVKDFADLDSPFTDLVDRSRTPRMPWHDIAVMVQGRAARDVARHFIQRWNAAKVEKASFNLSYPYLLPKSYDLKTNFVPAILAEKLKTSKTTCQVLRSVSQWSCGVQAIEDSIQQAYIESIQKAEHYIYIENQFFITLAEANPTKVMNRIGEAILRRILQAHREEKPFRVFVVIPLLPGFEGEVGTSRGVAIHAIVHWNYASICKGSDSLFARLERNGITDPGKYITFHGLRTWAELHGDLVTELIYVHSKLMIVDDKLVICGSANINDRSMLGDRDSEVAVIIQDEEFVQSVMDGRDYKAGKFGLSLRLQLFREHLGLLDHPEVDIRDAVHENFYNNIWKETSKMNTEIYDEVFRVMPTDKCESFGELQSYQSQHSLAVMEPVRARAVLRDARGYLVNLPLKFLRQENLKPPSGTTEGLMPTQLWT